MRGGGTYVRGHVIFAESNYQSVKTDLTAATANRRLGSWTNVAQLVRVEGKEVMS